MIVAIDKCLLYDSKGEKCLMCKDSMPDYSFKKCVAIDKPVTNCSKYSFITCKGCAENFLIDKNKFLYKL